MPKGVKHLKTASTTQKNKTHHLDITKIQGSTMRITVSWEEAQQLKLLLKSIIEPTASENEFIDLFCHKLDLEIAKEPSDKKRNATAKATDGRVKNAKLKIFNALNMMRLEGKKININSVARDAGVSYNTAKKYRAVIEAGKK